ncbi:hypothetical protein A9266_18395 [Vibrio tasmaniensis]|nr:hypothetical protein A9266_18395 [Vibrio tasmaniensis]
MDFVKAQVQCSQKIMPCQENGMKFILNNPSKKLVKQYEVDGNLISGQGQRKCDFMYEVFEPKSCIKYVDSKLQNCNDIAPFLSSAVYVELKGTDFLHAVDQIDETAKVLKQRHIKCKNKLGFIICSGVRHPKLTTTIQKLKVRMKKSHQITLKIETKIGSHKV